MKRIFLALAMLASPTHSQTVTVTSSGVPTIACNPPTGNWIGDPCKKPREVHCTIPPGSNFYSCLNQDGEPTKVWIERVLDEVKP